MSAPMFGLGPLAPDSRLHAVLAASLPSAPAASPRGVRWDAAFYGLTECRVWKALSEAERGALLEQLSTQTLDEAVGVEQAGVLYAARRIAESATREERSLYAAFAGDEARHLALLSPWTDRAPDGTSPFHALLAELVEHAPTPSLVLVVQVLLEGWGLRHYRDLARGALHPALSETFLGIVDDEARHHGSGNVLVAERGLTDDDVAAALPWVRRLLEMVRAGPTGVISRVDDLVGGLSPADMADLRADLRARDHAARRLDLLRGLLRPVPRLVAALDAEGAFQPSGAP